MWMVVCVCVSALWWPGTCRKWMNEQNNCCQLCCDFDYFAIDRAALQELNFESMKSCFDDVRVRWKYFKIFFWSCRAVTEESHERPLNCCATRPSRLLSPSRTDGTSYSNKGNCRDKFRTQHSDANVHKRLRSSEYLSVWQFTHFANLKPFALLEHFTWFNEETCVSALLGSLVVDLCMCTRFSYYYSYMFLLLMAGNM